MWKNILQKLNLSSLYRRFLGIVALVLLVFLPVEFFIFSSKHISDDDLYWRSFLENNKAFSIMVPKNMGFAGEKIPYNDFTVIEGLERELLVNTYFHSQTILMHQRANRWFPIIEPILKKNGVPDDFKYLALVESNLSNSVSPKGATGFWQFIEGTAKQYGLEMNDEIDERYNVEKSTEAACKYFNQAYKAFENWTLVAASYNIGIEGLKNQIDKQKTNSYYNLALNDETARYVFRVLAVKEIISHPKNYGFLLRKKDLYPVITTQRFKIDSGITDLASFAQQHNISYKILKYFNYWLRKSTLTNKDKKTYYLDIPKPGYDEEYMARITSFNESTPDKKDNLNAVSEKDTIPSNE